MADASTTASTGRLKRCARSAALGSPSNKPITPSTMMRSASCAAAASRERQSTSPVIHKSSWYTGAPLASASQYGSRKSGPHLNTRTLRPWRVCRRARAEATVVLPWPEAGAATRMAGQVAVVNTGAWASQCQYAAHYIVQAGDTPYPRPGKQAAVSRTRSGHPEQMGELAMPAVITWASRSNPRTNCAAAGCSRKPSGTSCRSHCPGGPSPSLPEISCTTPSDPGRSRPPRWC